MAISIKNSSIKNSHFGLNIVTDGLVLCVDAANTKSYPGSGTTWTDLSGKGFNGTIYGSPSFSSDNWGSIVFDGSNDDVVFPTSLNSAAYDFYAASGYYYTVSCWFKPNTSDTSKNCIFSKAGGFGGSGNLFVFFDGTNVGTSMRGSYDDDSIVDGTLTSEWHEVVITWDGSTCSAYFDGIFVSNPSVGSAGIQARDFTIGNADSGAGSEAYKGNISVCKVYNRGLSAAEVKQNFNALKSRFGL